jgi:hypothetical protein
LKNFFEKPLTNQILCDKILSIDKKVVESAASTRLHFGTQSVPEGRGGEHNNLR